MGRPSKRLKSAAAGSHAPNGETSAKSVLNSSRVPVGEELEVLYLDSIDLDGFVMLHNSLPRVRDFPFEKMCVMISVDNNFARHIREDEDLAPVKTIEWERSYYTLRSVYNEAVKNFTCVCLGVAC